MKRMRAKSAYDMSPRDAAAASRFINLNEQLGVRLCQMGNRQRGNAVLLEAVEWLDTAIGAGVTIDAQSCGLVYYNGGRAKAHQNQLDEALALIEKAINHGFSDFAQLRADEDLAAVRALPGFSEKLQA